MPKQGPQQLGVGVLTISDSRTLETDKSGACAVELLEAAGHRVAERAIVADDEVKIRQRAKEWIARADIDVVVMTGGTGITGRDVTPEAVAPLITKRIDGFGELFRALSYPDIGAATIQSRCEAGVASGTLVFILPGSTGAVRLALDKIIVPQLDSRTKPCNFATLLPRLRERA
jgi:molybdenum cofactor biosynthesis protein B